MNARKILGIVFGFVSVWPIGLVSLPPASIGRRAQKPDEPGKGVHGPPVVLEELSPRHGVGRVSEPFQETGPRVHNHAKGAFL